MKKNIKIFILFLAFLDNFLKATLTERSNSQIEISEPSTIQISESAKAVDKNIFLKEKQDQIVRVSKDFWKDPKAFVKKYHKEIKIGVVVIFAAIMLRIIGYKINEYRKTESFQGFAETKHKHKRRIITSEFLSKLALENEITISKDEITEEEKKHENVELDNMASVDMINDLENALNSDKEQGKRIIIEELAIRNVFSKESGIKI